MNRTLESDSHSPIGMGLRLVLANKRLLLWLYLANLAVGLYTALPFHARISPILDHSFAAERIAGRFDVSAFGVLMLNLGRHGTSLFTRVFHAVLVYGVIANVLAAGIYFVLVTGELPRLSIVVRSGIEYFWRFFRLMIFAIVICGAILAALAALRQAILKQADNLYVGRRYFAISLITLIVVALVAVFLRLWFDIAEARTIQLGQVGIRRVRRTIGRSWHILWRRFGAAYFGYLLIAIAGVVGFAFFVWLWMEVVPPRAVFLAWIFGQLGVLCLLAARIWQRGMAAALATTAEAASQAVSVAAIEPAQPPVLEISAEPGSVGPGFDVPASNPNG